MLAVASRKISSRRLCWPSVSWVLWPIGGNICVSTDPGCLGDLCLMIVALYSDRGEIVPAFAYLYRRGEEGREAEASTVDTLCVCFYTSDSK